MTEDEETEEAEKDVPDDSFTVPTNITGECCVVSLYCTGTRDVHFQKNISVL